MKRVICRFFASLCRTLGASEEADRERERAATEVKTRQARIEKLRAMRRLAIESEDTDMFEYADKKLSTLDRLQKEAEVLRLEKIQ